ncbi:hypothetical protein KL86PLE_110082 [uncultured Pleomorphomonas sp.]|uniref:Uncharacterized protein n=1 Tax=uncultured Pleomorphomonas sp. TaxID=442121 RepID=A0A212L7F5_9HYPH|nr:hypothetical protein [uncultured Pleomorphomonas sp.]SCM73476.1 hypothetical protein KL86PLE_110082 [uncultured Pleomorphomonas sp.]
MELTPQLMWPPEWGDPPYEDLKEIDGDVLLGELVRRKLIACDTALMISIGEVFYTKDEAEDAFAPKGDDPRWQVDLNELETARADLFSGRRAEALIHLERALGGDFVGRLAAA